MADKMLRIAGRNPDGLAKAITSDRAGRIEVSGNDYPTYSVESFEGSGDLTQRFTQYVDGLVLSNDGDGVLEVYILDEKYSVKPGEVFEINTLPFVTAYLKGSTSYRGYAKARKSEYNRRTKYFLAEGVRKTSSNTIYWRGNVVRMKKTLTLNSVLVYGTYSALKIFEMNGNTLGDKLYETFDVPVSIEVNGFRNHKLDNAIQLTKDKSYLIVFLGGSGNRYSFLLDDDNSGEYLNDGEVEITGLTYRSDREEGSPEPETGITISYDTSMIFDIAMKFN